MAAAPPIVPMFRFMNRGGMVEDAPMGTGIMDLESARQMMFIGGVAKAIGKGLKSATRAAKKVFKSPFGKAALLGATIGILNLVVWWVFFFGNRSVLNVFKSFIFW